MTISIVKTAATSTALIVSLSVAGCSSSMSGHDMGSMASPAASSTPSSSAPATPAAGPHNQADVTFASEMIPHHNQAIEMSNLVLVKGDVDGQVTALAQRIKAAQAPEVAQMTGWLTGWGADPSMGGMHHDGGMHQEGGGMMSHEEMDALQQASGAEAGTLFLNGMIKHHTGAIAMADDELERGANPEAKKLAQAIVAAQRAEIAEMKQLGGR